MDDDTKAQITAQLTELIIDLAPDANLRPMYGGTVIELIRDDPKSRVGGFYVYGDYVSLELAHGATFADAQGVLEGSGKKRRHIKMRAFADIETKDCLGFLQLALA